MSSSERDKTIRQFARDFARRFPPGSFDDDPGGPWRAPGIPCECARRHARWDACPYGRECPHAFINRPRQSETGRAGARPEGSRTEPPSA